MNTCWETNASWLHDYGYDEFRVLGVFGSEKEAVDQIVFLANECGKLVADDISIFDAVSITLDARPCGPNVFEYSIDVYPDGTNSGLY